MIFTYFVPLAPLTPEARTRIDEAEITQTDRMAAEGLVVATTLEGDLFVAFAHHEDALAFSRYMSDAGGLPPAEGVIFQHANDLDLSIDVLRRARDLGLTPLFFLDPRYVGFITPHTDVLNLLSQLVWPEE
ncbi:MAG: hypothetical protein KM310_00180 [Clostridiales bacterium]|nr:hypothetical protein [Clostridiales bacterium]